MQDPIEGGPDYSGTVSGGCRYGALCTTPLGGGGCPDCDYPRAYAHPDSLLAAFHVEALWVRGTAVTVYSDAGLLPGVVSIIQRDGSQSQHEIPSVEVAFERSLQSDPKLRDTALCSLPPKGALKERGDRTSRISHCPAPQHPSKFRRTPPGFGWDPDL